MAARRIDHEDVPRAEYKARWRRAIHRLQSMEKSERAGDLEAAQILALHAAVAAADAFTIHHLGRRCASARHEDAASMVAQVAIVPEARRGSLHLRRILREKNLVEYSGRDPRSDETAALCDHTRRFVEFVKRNLPAS